jgi:L-malate glycosyltransferase
MRVLYFSTDFGPHDDRFLTALARTKHDVHFLRLLRRGASVEDPGIPAGIQELEWSGSRGPFRWWEAPRLALSLRRVVREVKPDLIHAGPVQTCAFVAVLSGSRPVLTMSWGFDLMQDAERSVFSRGVTEYTLRRSSFFVSDALVTRAKAVSYGMPSERTAVFPWGVDLRRFRPRPRMGKRKDSAPTEEGQRRGMRRGSRARRFDILCNRTWEARYGVDVLAQAFVIAARQLPGARLILVGDGSQRTEIRSILEHAGLLDRVEFRGRIPEAKIHLPYRKADLFISASHVDGSSVSLMEAMASGTPVLVSDIPANCEWVTDDVNGWLFRDGDVEHLAERIVWIASHRGSLSRISAAARKIAEDRADWRRNFRVLLESYEQTVAQGGRL